MFRLHSGSDRPSSGRVLICLSKRADTPSYEAPKAFDMWSDGLLLNQSDGSAKAKECN
jgi:hypothetical protein